MQIGAISQTPYMNKPAQPQKEVSFGVSIKKLKELSSKTGLISDVKEITRRFINNTIERVTGKSALDLFEKTLDIYAKIMIDPAFKLGKLINKFIKKK